MSDSTVRTDLALRARYSQGGGIYRIVPAGVARPVTIAGLRDLIAAARVNGLQLVPRGAGSAMPGSNVGLGVVVDLTALDAGRCTIDAAHRRANLSPATTLAALNAAAASVRLRFPVDPSSGAWATLGGMTSTNAGGARTFQVGSTRRWVESVQIETTDGPLVLRRNASPDAAHPVIRRWHQDVEPRVRAAAGVIRERYPRVAKNSAGFALDRYLESGSLVDIVVGSEGTLGILSDLSLRLDPLPSARASVRIALSSRADLARALDAVASAAPANLEFLDGSFLQLVGGPLAASAGVLLADFEGDDAQTVAISARAAVAAVDGFAVDARAATDDAGIAELWRVRHGASPVLAALTDGRQSLQIVEDGCVPRQALVEYLAAVDAACRAARIDVVMFGHAGDGHVHVNLLPNTGDTDWVARVRQIFEQVTAAVVALGGTPSGEHGAGRLRAGVLEALYGSEVMACFAAIKAAFDPAGIFNPGVIISGAADPFTHLKVGSGATPLPDGIATWLAGIEAGAKWGTSRYF
ncbi:MAG TPA: FAD-binding oxidoreductase [Gemmatimonadales bacterium]|nr:FAD-binding oxidoreductase [Gemmatimonadales bacterium]